jgi:hypothetical protein
MTIPACKQLYFLGYLQNHNWWYCARWTPIVMFCCLVCIDCLRNTWNLVDQFRKLLSNVTWSVSFESSWNRIPERGSPPCCFSRTLNYLKACLLQIAVAGAGLNLPSMRPIFEVLSIWVSFEEIRVLLKFNSKFSASHLLMAIPSYFASTFRNFRYCSWWCNILGCWTLFL